MVLRSALGLVGFVLLLIGAGFLTAAAWIAITLAEDALTAALVIGGTYFGLGLIILVVASVARPRPPVVAPPPVPATGNAVLTGVLVAFVEGLGAGLASRRPRR